MKKLLIFILTAVLSVSLFAYTTVSVGEIYTASASSSDKVAADEVTYMSYISLDAVKTDVGIGISNVSGDDVHRVSPVVALLWNIDKYTLSIEGYTPFDIECNDFG